MLDFKPKRNYDIPTGPISPAMVTPNVITDLAAHKQTKPNLALASANYLQNLVASPDYQKILDDQMHYDNIKKMPQQSKILSQAANGASYNQKIYPESSNYNMAEIEKLAGDLNIN